MLHIMGHGLEHTLTDSLKILPFLFITYLAMEFLEHKAGEKVNRLVQKSGRLGPVWGAVLGVVPQCGFSAAASNLYAGRVITLGTLMAIYLSTSDEMLPILISEKAPMEMILMILSAKVIVGIIFGFLIDFLFRVNREEPVHIHEVCEHEHCQCERGILRSSIYHTLQIFFYIFIIGFVLEVVLQLVGENVLTTVLTCRPFTGTVLSGLVGLLPNCAASVIITQLYLENVLGPGAMLSGLLTNAGVGLLVLFRVNHNRKENLKILGMLYLIGVLVGVIVSLF